MRHCQADRAQNRRVWTNAEAMISAIMAALTQKSKMLDHELLIDTLSHEIELLSTINLPPPYAVLLELGSWDLHSCSAGSRRLPDLASATGEVATETEGKPPPQHSPHQTSNLSSDQR